ncbi:MAG: FAD-dependent oxidoreductase [Verrucomicrobiae bacterium]|nr:FAD-dependent oxidoreductase [Verrucomicrobiae bacterium]
MTEADSAVSDGTGSPVPAHAEALVLGGGPCGLYAALTLARAGKKVVLLEKEEVPGGLARGHRRGNNNYDLGVHMLHAFDPEVFETIKGIMGDERVEVPLNALIKWAGSFYRYPLQFGDMVKGMNKVVLLKCCLGLLAYQFRFKVRPREPQNAEEALIQLYGRPLYRFFFREFTHRYWGFPPTQLSATFITTKMPRLSAVDVLKKALGKFGIKDKSVRAVDSALLEETLHYSRTGAEAMPRAISGAITQAGGSVIQEAEVTRILTRDGRVHAVEYLKDGTTHQLECDECISTIPIPWLASRTEPPPPLSVQEAAGSLRFKPISIYGLLVKKERCIDALYIYYRDRAFHRVGEPKNAGLTVEPADHTVLIVETTCEIGDEKWRGTDAAKAQIFTDLEQENICRREDIVETHLLRGETGYPIFALGFEPHLKALQDWVDQIPNLQSTGRQGGFKYPNMHSAMRMGATSAQRILKRHGIKA